MLPIKIVTLLLLLPLLGFGQVVTDGGPRLCRIWVGLRYAENERMPRIFKCLRYAETVELAATPKLVGLTICQK